MKNKNNIQSKVNMAALRLLKLKSELQHDVPIESLWKYQPVVIIFVRHFSSDTCRATVKDLWNCRKELIKANVQIIIIGIGSSQAIKTFKQDLDLSDIPIYTDPTLRTFDACGLRVNQSSTSLLGGIVAFKPPGKVIYHYISD